MIPSRASFVAAVVYVALASAAGTGATAQVVVGSPITLEGRAGLSFPSGALSGGQRDIALQLGLSFGAAAVVRVGPGLSMYAGASQHGFGCQPRYDCDDEGDFTSRGYEGGVEFVLPHQTIFVPWLRAGATLHSFRYRTGGGFETETERALGFELGGGVSIPMAPRLSLAPSIRFARYVATLDLNTYAAGGEPFTVTRILAEVGARFRF